MIKKEEIFVISKAKLKAISKRDSEVNFKDKPLEYEREFLSSLEEARKEYLKLGGLSIDEYLKKRRT